jgi:hypothetical protein
MRILISGASIAGPVLAYWLACGRFEVTVVERAPALRKTGGHAVDLFRPSMEISAKMGVLPRIESLATFMFRSKTEFDYHYRDTLRQKELLHDALAGLAAEADRWLAEVDHTPTFYFDSISQLALDIIPGSAAAVWAVTRGAQLVSSLPAPFTRAVAKSNTKGVRMHDSMPVPDYPDVGL